MKTQRQLIARVTYLRKLYAEIDADIAAGAVADKARAKSASEFLQGATALLIDAYAHLIRRK